ncbi:TonB-dependent receptor [Gammaproteobacteria bacterium]|nr:TonB-dependent receptor [Gammaproteobacteria bacterium]MDB4003086.1 TonB-dependent receptor [Gammaproteobacteria bacterium]MDB4137657.1 TonB-dependent receptor [Gammaproteobacteria bacterium]
MINRPKMARRVLPTAIALGLLVPAGFAPLALAQQADEMVEEIVTIGSRRPQRSNTDSSVPVDVISGDEFVNMGFADMDDMLKTAIPSYNVARNEISDAATIVRPANLRGLPPDNVLILVNGKRRHRSGVIAELGGSLSSGSQGADISAIPSMAIKQVEVLRDGAAALYGSDAIAGVIGFQLNDSAEGMSLEVRTGESGEGDGGLTQVQGNIGLPLGDDGFLNITGSWMEQDPTSRSLQRTDAINLLTNGNAAQKASVASPYAQVWGAPEQIDNYNIFVNSGIEVSDSLEVYAFGNYGSRETLGGFYFRNPNSRGGVYTNGSTRAVVDTNIRNRATGVTSNCPALTSPGSGGNGVPLDQAAVAADALAMANLPSNCFVMNQPTPGGYTPQFGAQLKDASIVIGGRGDITPNLSYDISGSYGRNAVSFLLNNSWNPSNGPDGFVNGELQRNFDIGQNVQSETNFNIDMNYTMPVDGLASDLNIAFGGEWRDERFETIVGEKNSWVAGRFAFQNVDGSNTYSDGVTPLPNLSIGAHGFAGFSPEQAGYWGRSNYAVYTDFEADITDSFTAGLAVRYEDFESFGDTTNFKVSGRYRLTDALAVRASYNTGFRAPTPGQENVTKLSTITVDGELQQRGQIPPTNPIAGALGAQALKPEDSKNYSLGMVWDVTGDINVTVDYFNIEIQDRIAATGTIDISSRSAIAGVGCPAALAAGRNLALCLQEAGVPGAADLSSVSFYTNDFSTTTQGVDLVATWNLDFGDMGNGTLNAAWNWTETEVDNAGQEVNRNRVVGLENQNPQNRGVFTYNHFLNDFRFLARLRTYDDWIDSGWSGDTTSRGPNGLGYTINCGFNTDNCYSGESVVDLEAAYTWNSNYTFVVGANNAFDQDAAINQNNLDGTIGDGSLYAGSTPWGTEGAFYYARVRVDF